MRDEAHRFHRLTLYRPSEKAVGEQLRGLLRAVGLPRREATDAAPSDVGFRVNLGKLSACRSTFSPLGRVGGRLNTAMALSNAIDHA
jgi:hypothetical protein